MKISKQIEIPKFPVSLEEKFCFRTWRCTWRCTTQGCTPAPFVTLVWRDPFLLCGTWRLVRYAFLSELALRETLRSLGETFCFRTWRRIGGWGGRPTGKSFRFVRACERAKLCVPARRCCFQWVGFGMAWRAHGRRGACPSPWCWVRMGNHFLKCSLWDLGIGSLCLSIRIGLRGNA